MSEEASRELGPLGVRDRCIVVGKVGYGKSTWVKQHLRAELAAGRRVVAVDLHDEYSLVGDSQGGEVTLGPLANHISIAELLERPELLDLDHLSMAVLVRSDEDDAADDFTDLANLAYSTGNLVLVADEVGHYSELAGRPLKKLATQGRHRAITLILASQRLVDVPPKARAQASVAVLFHQDHPADLTAIAELTRSEETADAVSRLDVGQCLVWRDNKEGRT